MEISSARHAFITGGASGIGLGIADALAERGVAVTIADINEETLDSVLLARSDRYQGALLDVRDREGWQRAKAEAEAAFGPVDILVNNAGIAPDGMQMADMDPASFDRVIAINLTGVFNGIHTFGAGIRAQGRGHIVNTASMAGMVAEHPGLGSYGASKFGVVAMSEVLRREMQSHGIGVSVLCPGMVATSLPANTMRVGGTIRDASVSMIEAELKPDAVGEMVVRGIEENRLYIFTHPERRDAVEQRFAAIMAGFYAA